MKMFFALFLEFCNMAPRERLQKWITGAAAWWVLLVWIIRVALIALAVWLLIFKPIHMMIVWHKHRQQYNFFPVTRINPVCQEPLQPVPGLVGYQPRRRGGAPPPSQLPHLQNPALVETQEANQHADGSHDVHIEMPQMEAAGAHQQHQQSKTKDSHVIQRGNISPITSMPWTVVIGYHFYMPYFWRSPQPQANQSPITHCTGVLIRPDWILTAGHCVKHYGIAFYATAGTDCRPEKGGVLQAETQIRRVRRVHFFVKTWRPGWSSLFQLPTAQAGKHNKDHNDLISPIDMALLHLESPFTSNERVQPIKVAALEDLPNLEIDKILVSGWGNVGEPSRDAPGDDSHLAVRLRGMRFKRPPVDEQNAWGMDELVDQYPRYGRYVLPNCRATLYCIRIQPGEASIMGSDSGGPWVAKLRDRRGLAVDDWRLVAVGQSIDCAARPNCPPDELDNNPGGSEADSGRLHNIGVRVANSEKLNWMRRYIPDLTD